jgi:prepilin-type processing-associated H-X9-DG protein
VSNPPPSLDYATPQPRSRRWFWPVFVSIAVALILAALAVVDVAPHHPGSRPVANRAKCQSNLRAIGAAIQIYQSQNAGTFPPSFDELLLTTTLSPARLVCGESNDEAAYGPTTQAMLTDLHRPGHLSYIYLGQGLTNLTATADTVIAYEPLSNHNNTGMNILFGDGHAEWWDAKIAPQIIAAAATGQCVHLAAGMVWTTPKTPTTQK